jgi:hypothetical protein
MLMRRFSVLASVPKPVRPPVMWWAVAFALLAALAYVLIGFNVLAVGDLQTSERPATIIYVAASSYALGGLLILARRRWLWIIGAAINALVIFFFLQMYQARPAVLFSPGGIVSKVAQLLLEASLVYLIVSSWLRARDAAQP